MDHATINMVFYLFVVVEMSIEELAEKLPQVTNRKWSVETVSEILTNPANREVIQDDEAWEIAQQSITSLFHPAESI